ncbi:hypothetical protein J7W08_05890 [Methanococcoides orientis]|uniref:hypothetical protein n=1 Tax=Methanococcoides orientis TaxID=2822137 RepID=UPI001E4E3BC2|nr:hypothetical protein [Methanococcoides orientis]UGV41805.1 hypothetical protein J7W08_05890 [Methanococcoides orientis]
MDTLTVIGIAILAFVLIVAVTAMNLKAASSFKTEASGSSSSVPGSDTALVNDEFEDEDVKVE